MSEDASLTPDVGLAIRKALSPICSPAESKQELIKEYAKCQSDILELPCRPPDSISRKMEDVERKWARYGLRRQLLHKEASKYLFPLRGSSDTIEVDGVIVGSQIPDVENARSPHFLSVETGAMYTLQDGMWHESIEAPNNGYLIEKAREEARIREVGRLSQSEYL